MAEERVAVSYSEEAPPVAVEGEIIEGATVWYGADLKPEDVLFKLDEQDLREIDAAMRAVESKGLAIEEITKEEFPLPRLGPALERIHKDVIYGRGFRVIQNLPSVQTHPLRYAATALWGVGTHFGAAVPLNQTGHLLGHVRDVGPLLQGRRTNLTHHPMGYHNDNADIVFLMCLNQAKSGGASSCISAHALHNEVLRRRPDLYQVLCGAFYQDRFDWWPEGQPPYYVSPFFHFHPESRTLGVEAVGSIESAAQFFPGVPPVSEQQREALRFVQEVAAEGRMRFDHLLQPGELLINHNLVTFHARDAWEDGGTEETTRHMLRLWLASPLGWPLDPLYAERWYTTELGKRGGIVCPGSRPHVALAFEEYVQDILDWVKEYRLTATTDKLKVAAVEAGQVSASVVAKSCELYTDAPRTPSQVAAKS